MTITAQTTATICIIQHTERIHTPEIFCFAFLADNSICCCTNDFSTTIYRLLCGCRTCIYALRWRRGLCCLGLCNRRASALHRGTRHRIICRLRCCCLPRGHTCPCRTAGCHRRIDIRPNQPHKNQSERKNFFHKISPTTIFYILS